MKLPNGTPILAMDSPTFAEDFRKAIGLQPGEALEISGPQFERTDGMQVPMPDLSVADFQQLATRDEATLKALGLGIWNRDDKGTHWLFPKEWYSRIPDGLEIVSISGERELFKRGETDDDYRFGMLAFGFLQAVPHD
jgi:hypothetical protein